MYAKDAEEALVPLFSNQNDNERLSQIGTGIFVEVQSMPFLFTAAHVTDHETSSRLHVPVYNGIEPIDGYLAHIDLHPEDRRENDMTDIAYYRLSSQFASALCSRFKPLPQKRLKLVADSLTLGMFSVVGYPVSKSKQLGNRYTSELAFYRGVAANSDVYESEKLLPDSTQIIHFHRKHAVSPVDGRAVNMVSPRGISGGGVFAWPLGKEFSNDWSCPQLVGIFHTYREGRGLMIGTPLIYVYGAIQLGQMKGFGGVV